MIRKVKQDDLSLYVKGGYKSGLLLYVKKLKGKVSTYISRQVKRNGFLLYFRQVKPDGLFLYIKRG